MNPSHTRQSLLATAALAVALSACSPAPEQNKPSAAAAPTVAEALAFIDEVEAALRASDAEFARMQWIGMTYINDDSQALVARGEARQAALQVRYAKEAERFRGLELPDDARRKLDKLRTGITLPAPADAAKTLELATLAARLKGIYGSAAYCRDGHCRTLPELEAVLAGTSTDAEGHQRPSTPAERLDAWRGWHDAAGAPMRADYTRMVELLNDGARELGFADDGELWRSNFDMPPAEFAAELDRLWNQVKPLYDAMHCHARGRLNAKYGEAVVPAEGPLPAHMLGNMWSQEWVNIYDDLREPDWKIDSLNPALAKKYGAPTDLAAGRVDDWRERAEGRMVQTGEAFFTGMGFAPLPETFWQRSMFVQPVDHDAVCHASAWSLDAKEDLRIKMCIRVNEVDFATIHHELGHNMYQRAYNGQPYLLQAGANGGFHEALGDTLTLGITPAYLTQIGLMDREPDASQDIALLMQRALKKVAVLPWTVLLDRWRWEVFAGKTTPANYNARWWELRREYQGVVPAVPRDETAFDPGAKYHVAGNVSYERYFLAQILQFQFYRAMCRQAGWEGPLHRCTFFGNREVGARLEAMMKLGQSRPWPDALEALTGERRMDASAINEYFAPLKQWLDAKNSAAGRQCGW